MATLKIAQDSYSLVVMDNRSDSEVTDMVWDELADLVLEATQGDPKFGFDQVEQVVRQYVQDHGYTYKWTPTGFVVEVTSLEKVSKSVWEDEFHEGDIVELADGRQARVVSVDLDGYTLSSAGEAFAVSHDQVGRKVGEVKIGDGGYRAPMPGAAHVRLTSDVETNWGEFVPAGSVGLFMQYGGGWPANLLVKFEGQDELVNVKDGEYEILPMDVKSLSDYAKLASKSAATSGLESGDFVTLEQPATGAEGEPVSPGTRGLVMEVTGDTASVRFIGIGRVSVPVQGLTKLYAKQIMADNFYGQTEALFARLQDRLQGVATGFDEAITETSGRLTWTDTEMQEQVVLDVLPTHWTLSIAGQTWEEQGAADPDLVVVAREDLYVGWAQDHWAGGHEPPPEAEDQGVESGKLLALRGTISKLKFAEMLDEELSPLHRFYQARDIPGDPQRTVVADGVDRVYKAMGNLADYVRIVGVQFERIEGARYAGTDRHVDRGKLWLKLELAAGGPIPRRARLSVVMAIREGQVEDAVQFIDASGHHRLLNREGIKACLNLQDKPSILRAPDVERAQIDRTLLPPTPSKSLFRGRGGVDA